MSAREKPFSNPNLSRHLRVLSSIWHLEQKTPPNYATDGYAGLFPRMALSRPFRLLRLGVPSPSLRSSQSGGDLMNIGVPEDVLAAIVTIPATANPSRGRGWTAPGQVPLSTPQKSTSAIPAAPKTPSRSSAPLPEGMNTMPTRARRPLLPAEERAHCTHSSWR